MTQEERIRSLEARVTVLETYWMVTRFAVPIMLMAGIGIAGLLLR